MKNFTRLLMALPLFVLSFSVSAQNFDFGCVSVDFPLAGSVMYDNLNPVPSYTRENFGDALPAGHPDTLFMDVTANGVVLASLIRNPANAFAMGAQEATGAANPVDLNIANLSPGNFDFCVATRFNGDTDSTNNQACVSLVWDGNPLNLDLGVVAINLLSPSTTTFPAGTQVDSFEVEVRNLGTQTIPQGLGIPMTHSTINGSEQDVLFITSNLAAGSSVFMNVAGALVPDLPTDLLGATTLCSRTESGLDVDNLNDEFCLNLTLEGPADPTITQLDPNQAVPNHEINITGTDFNTTAANNTVDFNGQTATANTATSTLITVNVPQNATTGPVKVIVDNGFGDQESNELPFTVLTPDPTNPLFPLGLGENELRIGSAYYAGGNLNVNFFNNTNANNAQMTITNLNGQVVANKQVMLQGANNLQETLALDVAKGVYVLTIATDNGVSQQTRFPVTN